jgi:hypothetical protein
MKQSPAERLADANACHCSSCVEIDKQHRAYARRIKHPDHYAVVDALYGKCASCARILPSEYRRGSSSHHRKVACAGCLTARYCTRGCLADHRYSEEVEDGSYVFKGHKEACDKVAAARTMKKQGIRGASKEVRNARHAVGVDVLARWECIPALHIEEKVAYMPASLVNVAGLARVDMK